MLSLLGETKFDNFEKVLNLEKQCSLFFNNGTNHSKGVLIGIRNNLPIVIKECVKQSGGRVLGLRILYNEKSYFVVNVYAPTKSSEKVEKKDSNISSEPLLVGTYTLENKNYKVEKIEAGFILKNKTTGEREAFINKTSNNSILYNSESINGTLTLSPENNLEVEYFNKESGALEKIIFIRVE